MSGSRADPSGTPPSNPTELTCPTCHGALREVRDLPIPTFRCRTGHLFSIDSLVAALEQDAEDGLWTALRVLFEAIDAERELAAAVRKRGDEKHARQAEERAARHARQIESIRAAIEME